MHTTTTRRRFLQLAGLSAASLTSSGLIAKAAPAPPRPNIVMILADDMGFSDLGCFGSEVPTPALDALATGGMRFTAIHNTAKCFPSRACLLTGVYAQQCGMARSFKKITNAVTLGEVLRPAGYRTLASGKHHSAESLFDRGFDHYWGLRDGCCNYFNPGLQRKGEPVPSQKRKRTWCDDAKVSTPFTPADPNFYTTDAFTDKAIGWLKQYKNETKPFFLYLAYTAPHDPLMAPAADIAKYKGKYDDGYAPIRAARWKKQQALGLFDATKCKLSKPEHRDWKSLSAKERKLESQRMEVYAAMIDRMDRNIGKLVKTLRDQGKLDNTLILFAADNGASPEVPRPRQNNRAAPIGSMARWESLHRDWANVCDTPFRKYKSSSYEGGICTPMIAYWPKGIPAGKINRTTGHFVDILPTLAELAGASYPKTHNGQCVTPLQGTSLVPCFAGDALKRTAPLFFQWAAGRAVIDGQWKLVTHSKGDSKWELYDLTADRTETTNLASAHPARVKKLREAWTVWYAACKKQ